MRGGFCESLRTTSVVRLASPKLMAGDFYGQGVPVATSVQTTCRLEPDPVRLPELQRRLARSHPPNLPSLVCQVCLPAVYVGWARAHRPFLLFLSLLRVPGPWPSSCRLRR